MVLLFVYIIYNTGAVRILVRYVQAVYVLIVVGTRINREKTEN